MLDLLRILKEDINESDEQLVESSLSRVLEHTQVRDFCIITAYRNAYSKKKNEARNRELLASIKDLKCGGIALTGVWQESPEDIDYEDAKPEDLTEVVENSYFIPKPDSMSSKEFVDKMFELGNKYNQDTILLVCKSEGYCGVYKTKSRTIDNPFPTGKIQVNKIEQAYSRMRGKNIPFVFK